MIEAFFIFAILAVVYIALAKREAAKDERRKGEVVDAKRANEILTKSATRHSERVRKLDDAGYRD